MRRLVLSPRFAALQKHAAFNPTDRPAIAGISGGATSGTMAALLGKRVYLSFQNTGAEHPRTYEFLGLLVELIERDITWLEYRPPKRRGAPPGESRYEIVDFRTADRTGAPFEMMLDAIAAYRATLGKGPIAPWWRSRICTTYLKTRLARAWIKHHHQWSTWNELVGLRADEPNRVTRLQVGVPKRIGRRAPLSDAGITIEGITEFWTVQPFRLDLPARHGNCTGCFLKDQADLSRALHETNTTAMWARLARKFPSFGGKNFAGYERLAAEAPLRFQIEAALVAGVEPQNDNSIEPQRFRLVVIQERKRLAGLVAPFSCACEGSDAMTEMEDEDLDALIGVA